MLTKKRISVLYFIRLIKWDLVAIALYSILAGTFDHYWIFKQINIPLAVSAMVGTMLSLLLGFRTSQSYERWWEARVVWGAIVNDSRTLIRQLQQFLPNSPKATPILSEFIHRQVIWCYALSESLRRVPFSVKVEDYVRKHQFESANLPNLLLNKHSENLRALSEQFQIDANKQIQIDATIVRLCDSMGKCERIKNTVFPRSYSVLIHFLIYVLMTMLPFGLEDKTKTVEILLTFMVPVLFIAIERTAIIMQDPFENVPTDTPMTTLSKTIEANLQEMIGEKPIVQQSIDKGYYVM
jgi:putative membrane protein